MWVHITCNQNIHNVRISKHDRFRTFYNILVIGICSLLQTSNEKGSAAVGTRTSRNVFLWNSTRDPPQQHVCRRRSVWCTCMRVILFITIIIICCSSVPNCGTRVPSLCSVFRRRRIIYIFYTICCRGRKEPPRKFTVVNI